MYGVRPTDTKLQETDSANARPFVAGGIVLQDSLVHSVSDVGCSPSPTSGITTIQIPGDREDS